MKIKIKHRSKRRMRIELPYFCNRAVQLYFEEVKQAYPMIERLYFYKDRRHIGIYFCPGEEEQVFLFFAALDTQLLETKQQEGLLSFQESPYDIISTHIYRKLIMRMMLPQPLRIGLLLWRMGKFGREALQSIIKRKLSMSVLDFVAIVTSMAMGDHKTADTIMFLLNLGDELDEWSQKKSIEDLEKNLTAQIYELWIEKDGERFKKLSNQVDKGDVFVVSEGQEVYFDGIVVDGRGYLNESSLTGESFPVSKKRGDTVYANTVVEDGELLIEVTNAEQNSRLQQIVQLIKSSEFHQSQQQKYLIEKADSLVKYNFIGMIGTYLLTRSISKALTFLLVDYSCALKLSSPITYLIAIKEASTKGIVIKGANSLDKVSQIDTFVFDKTGTLTTGIPKIRQIIPYEGYSEKEVLRIAACLEEHIYHPIATAVVKKAADEGIEHEEMHGQLTHVASKGILSSIDGERVVIGSLELLKDEAVQVTQEQSQIIEEFQQKYNLLYLGYKHQLIAIFLIDTPLRVEALKVLQALRERGKKLVLLTGDTAKRTENLQTIVQFDEVYAQVKPNEKYQMIQKLKEQGNSVLMIGDGLNDSAALSLADIGVVMANSSDVARQASDILLLNDRLASLIELEELTFKLKQQLDKNLRKTVMINSLLMGLGLFDILSPSVLAVLHNLTTTAIIGESFTYIKK